MKILEQLQLDYDDVMILPQRSTISSRKEVSLEREFKFYHSNRTWYGIPIMSANMAFVGKEFAKVMTANKMITVLPKFLSVDQIVDIISSCSIDYVWMSVGFNVDERVKVLQVHEKLGKMPNIVIDIPNAYIGTFTDFCKQFRGIVNYYSKEDTAIITAGNVCTPDMAKELIISGGVDIVKVGIGGGAQCLTRSKTGVGFPQFSANLACSDVHGLKNGEKRLGLFISDGGCKNAGDVCKALCSSSDFVMLGSMFAGTDECEGEWEYEKDMYTAPVIGDFEVKYKDSDRKKALISYGLSSTKAQEKHFTKKDYRTSEGRVVKIPYKGPLQNVIDDILGGIRSNCTYIGASCVKDMSKCATFARVTNILNKSLEQYTIGE